MKSGWTHSSPARITPTISQIIGARSCAINAQSLAPAALDEASVPTARYLDQILGQVRQILSRREVANMILLRGAESYQPVRSLEERFLLKGLCVADYPMYRGVARFLGMDVTPPPGGLAAQIQQVAEHWEKGYNFFFLHVKATDKAGEDGDLERKIEALEAIDDLIPELRALNSDVLVVTGDHSTPAAMGRHSWHPVPVLIHAKTARLDAVERFDELSCTVGSLGRLRGQELMPLALAHAGRLRKFGA